MFVDGALDVPNDKKTGTSDRGKADCRLASHAKERAATGVQERLFLRL